MGIQSVLDMLVPAGIVLLCIAGVVALIALARLLFAITTTVQDTMVKVNPLLDDAKEMTATAKVALERVDPLLERITLTVDAGNLEIMRVDQILEDVNTITGNLTRASESIDTVSSIPLDLVSRATGAIRDRISPLSKGECTKVDAVVNAATQGLDYVDDKVEDLQSEAQAKRVSRDLVAESRRAAAEQANQSAAHLKDAFSVQAANDAQSAQNN